MLQHAGGQTFVEKSNEKEKKKQHVSRPGHAAAL